MGNAAPASDFNNTVEAIYYITAALGIALGLIGGYYAFLRKRLRFPRIIMMHTINSWQVTKERSLIRLTLGLSNKGEVLFKYRNFRITIYQLRPWPSEIVELIEKGEGPTYELSDGGWLFTEYRWPTLHTINPQFSKNHCRIEPGEDDELYFEFSIPSNVETILVYTFLDNPKKKGIGWNKTSVYKVLSGTLVNGGREG